MKDNPGRNILEKIYYFFEDFIPAKDEIITLNDWSKREDEWKKNHPILYKIRDCYYGIFYRFPDKVKRFPREVKWFFQRGKRGWADCDVWNFFDYNSRVCKEALTHLLKHKMGFPGIFHESGYTDEECEAKWNKILSQIIDAFDQAEKIGNMDTYMWFEGINPITSGEFCTKHEIHLQTKEEYESMIEGFKLFFEHYWSLWD